MHHPTGSDRIYIITEGVLGRVISLGAHASRVEFSLLGIMYDTVIENEDFFFLDELQNAEEWQD